MSWKVAVASTDGKFINQHFGRAKDFLIFQWENASFLFLERRPTDSVCGYSEEEHDNALLSAVENLADCQAVLAAQIGPGAKNILLSYGIKPYVVINFIEEALGKLAATLEKDKGLVVEEKESEK